VIDHLTARHLFSGEWGLRRRAGKRWRTDVAVDTILSLTFSGGGSGLVKLFPFRLVSWLLVTRAF
jgi:hypothetical protein